MSVTASKLQASTRSKIGTAECRRLRKQGRVPGNVYGHEIAPVAISAPAGDLNRLIHIGHHVVDVEIDGKPEKTLLKDVQFDAFGSEIQHFDLLRVSMDERVTSNVAIELKGTAPGTEHGGILEVQMHEIEIECSVANIPDSIVVRVTNLQIGDAIHVSDLELPEGTVALSPPDSILVHVVEPRIIEDEETEDEAGSAEPELIRKPEKEEEGED